MKKLLMLFYILILSMILYQLILGKNGIIEGYRLKKEDEALNRYTEYLMKETEKLKLYRDYLRKSDSAKKDLANNMGLFDDDITLYRIMLKKEDSINNLAESDSYLKEFVDTNIEAEKIDSIRVKINILFYIIISFFSILIVFGGYKKDD